MHKHTFHQNISSNYGVYVWCQLYGTDCQIPYSVHIKMWQEKNKLYDLIFLFKFLLNSFHHTSTHFHQFRLLNRQHTSIWSIMNTWPINSWSNVGSLGLRKYWTNYWRPILWIEAGDQYFETSRILFNANWRNKLKNWESDVLLSCFWKTWIAVT